jgi:uncharacterized phiE125 gp8 family phage protein
MLKLIESSPVLAVSLRKTKKYLRVEHDEDDRQIQLLIGAATSLVEQEIGQSLLTKVWKKVCEARMTKSGFLRINLLYPPLVKIITVHEVWSDTILRPVRRYIVEWERVVPAVIMASSAEKFEVVYQ